MFYLIQFNNIESKETQQLMFELAGFPNGTILSHCQHIKISSLPKDKWIVWLNKDNINRFDEEYAYLKDMDGIKSVVELDITKKITDSDWIWDDNYINNIFNEYI